MKTKYILFLTFLLLNLTCFSQIKLSANTSQIILPKDVKTNVKPATTSSKNSLNPDGTVNLSSLRGEYDFNGQNLSIRTVNIKKNPAFIADTKREMENSKMRYFPNDNYSEIYTTEVNGNECLISRNNGGGVLQNYYVFYVVNKENTSYVTGILMFSPGQESLAKENLANVLKGIKMN